MNCNYFYFNGLQEIRPGWRLRSEFRTKLCVWITDEHIQDSNEAWRFHLEKIRFLIVVYY